MTGLFDWVFVAANDLVLAEFWPSDGPWGLFAPTPWQRDRPIGTMVDLNLTAFDSPLVLNY